MGFITNAMISGFNGVAGVLNRASGLQGVGYLKGVIKDLNADGIKTYVLRPLDFAGKGLKYFQGVSELPLLIQHASAFKSMVGALEFFPKCSAMMSALATPIGGNESVKRKFWAGDHEVEAPKISGGEILSDRISKVAFCALAAADATHCAGNYMSVPEAVKKVVPWIFTVAGGFLGAHFLYQERLVLNAMSARSDNQEPANRSEYVYSGINALMSVSYLFASAVGAIGMFAEKSKLMGQLQFYASAGITVMPAIQRIATSCLGHTAH